MFSLRASQRTISSRRWCPSSHRKERKKARKKDKPRCLLLWRALAPFRNSVFERGNRLESVRSVVDARFPPSTRKFCRNLSDDPLAVWRLVDIRSHRHATREPRAMHLSIRGEMLFGRSRYFSFQCHRSFEHTFERIDCCCRLVRSIQLRHRCKQLSGIPIDLFLGMTVPFIQRFVWNLGKDEPLPSSSASKERCLYLNGRVFQHAHIVQSHIEHQRRETEGTGFCSTKLTCNRIFS